MHVSRKGVCDGCVKNRGWGWCSGQNETLSRQNETLWHLGNLHKKWQKCSRTGKQKFNSNKTTQATDQLPSESDGTKEKVVIYSTQN